jgi:hypothetical protein
MGETQYETCEVRLDQRKEGGGLFGKTFNYFKAIAGSRLVAKSEEFPEISLWQVEDKAQPFLNKLIQQLVADSWELVKQQRDAEEIIFEKRTMIFRKSNVKNSNTEKAALTPAELLRQLASLRDAGILTQEEFETKKAEILKRV